MKLTSLSAVVLAALVAGCGSGGNQKPQSSNSANRPSQGFQSNRAAKQGEPIPECPGGTSVCHIKVTLLQGVQGPEARLAHCDPFEVSDGSCLGTSYGTNDWVEGEGYQVNSYWTGLFWSPISNGPAREVDYRAYEQPHPGSPKARILGRLPSPTSCALSVRGAYTIRASGQWHTGNTGSCGTQGGPLRFVYDNHPGNVQTSVHIDGYLEKCPSTGCPPP
jgi:hypothetical protein